MKHFMLVAVTVGTLLISTAARAEPQGVDRTAGRVPDGARCAECGMTCDPGSFFVAAASDIHRAWCYCDVGDMLYAFPGLPGSVTIFVRDVLSGEWIEAKNALYVQDHSRWKTPMAWGIAAFAGAKDAERFGPVMNFLSALEVVR